MPTVSDRLSYEKWVEEGVAEYDDGVRAEVERLLAKHAERSYIEGDQLDALAAICGVDEESFAAHAASDGAAPTTRKHPNGGPMTLRIGYIGLGALGRHLAGSLLSAGFPLTVYDVDASCSIDLGRAGAACADSIAETARASDTVITCLPSPEAVASVVAGRAASSRRWPPAAPGST